MRFFSRFDQLAQFLEKWEWMCYESGKESLTKFVHGLRVTRNCRFVVMDGKILVIDDVATNRIVLKAKLSAARYQPLLASSGSEGMRLARTDRPDLILMDLRLPDMSGIELCAAFRQDPTTATTPIIAMTSSDKLHDRLKAMDAGADDVFTKSSTDAFLLARVRNLLRGHQDIRDLKQDGNDREFELAEDITPFAQPSRIAIVTHRKDEGMRLRRHLSPLMRGDIEIVTVDEAFSQADPDKSGPDLYLIDGENTNPTASIRRLLSDLRSRGTTRHASICLLSRTRALDGVEGMAFDLGANDIIDPNSDIQEIAVRLRATLRRKRYVDRTRANLQDGLRLAMIDPVTGLYNRRYAMARLTSLVFSQSETSRPLTILVADLDRFKRVNDVHGHAAGDQVLIDVAKKMQQGLRQQDLLARFGGEEFLIVLPETGLDAGNVIAQRLRSILVQNPTKLANGERVEVTASFGLAVLETSLARTSHDAEIIARDLIDQADAALLTAKASGRNMVTIARRDVA
ncbi:diguanylate cyclase [Thioclava sp. FR2]|uniref:diguanylate cyclase n=1 Tax=Thioclava sp. FR2 TaxID=3445780 RepID=UPI003EBB61A4